jgi:hypothetical protein
MPDGPSRLHLLVEGQTEEVVRDQLLLPWFEGLGFSVSGSTLQTGRTPAGVKARGGVSTWSKIERDIRLLLGDSSLTLLTTVIDYYGFPQEAPGMADRPPGDPTVRVAHVEAALSACIGDRRFLPPSRPPRDRIVGPRGTEPARRTLRGPCSGGDARRRGGSGRRRGTGERRAGDGAVEADPGCASDFQKTVDGPLALLGPGIDRLRADCPHLDAWMVELQRRAHPAPAPEA